MLLFDADVAPGSANAGRAEGTVRPAMVVAEPLLGDTVPLGLDEPLELRGGDRLGGGVAARLGCEWNADFLRWVDAAGRQQSASGRRWFRMDPTLLAGPDGAGRTHLARRLAYEAGVPHLPIDLAGGAPFGRAACGPTAAVPSPLSIGLFMSGCANPVIDVSGVGSADAATLDRLAVAIDPMRGRFDDEALGVTLDLSAATWLVQLPPGVEPPPALAEVCRVVTLARPDEPQWLELAWIETFVELAADRGLLGACDALADGMADLVASTAPEAACGAAERHRAAEALFEHVYGRV